jgi:hypothetical protein
MAKHRSDRERSIEVERWRASGMSARAYAAERGLSPASLWRWSSAESAGPEFVRLEVVSTVSSELVVEIGSARIRVSSGFDGRLLREVVNALTGEGS